jgi:hypothetical protein
MQHITADIEARLNAGELKDDALVAVLRHLKDCAECRHRRESTTTEGTGRLVSTWLAAGDDDAHLDTETIVGLVSGTLPAADREIAESHTDDCPACAAEVADLQSFQRRISPRTERPKRFWGIAAAAAAIIITATVVLDVGRTPRPTGSTAVTPPRVDSRPNAGTTALAPSPSRPSDADVHSYTSPEWNALVAQVRRTSRLPRAARPDLEQVLDTRRGNVSASVEEASPSATVVESTRPRFCWKPRPNGTYQVAVFNGEKEIARSRVLTEPCWMPSDELPRGMTYTWQVEWTFDGKTEILPSAPTPQPVFAIISEEEHAQLTLARRKHPTDLLLHAVLCAKYGLWNEAVGLLRRLAASGDAQALRILRTSVQDAEH